MPPELKTELPKDINTELDNDVHSEIDAEIEAGLLPDKKVISVEGNTMPCTYINAELSEQSLLQFNEDEKLNPFTD